MIPAAGAHDRRERAASLERTIGALRDLNEIDAILATVARSIGYDFGRTCAAFRWRTTHFDRAGGDESSPIPAATLDLQALALAGTIYDGSAEFVGIVVAGTVVAVIRLDGAHLRPHDRRHLRLLAGYASLAIANALALERLRRRAAEGAALVDAARSILAVTELGPLADALCTVAVRLVDASAGAVYEPAGDVLRPLSTRGTGVVPAELPIDEHALEIGVAAALGANASISRFPTRGTASSEPFGALVMVRDEPFDRADRRVIEALLGLAALALRNVELYERTAAASRELAESNSFKDDLMAMFAHDFRGPLTVISGFSELMLEHDDADARASAQTILDQTRRLTKLSDDALALAATQTSGFSLDRAREDLADFVREAATALDRDGRVVFEPPFAKVLAHFDRGRLRHAIDNVVANALKYSTDTVSVRVVSDRAATTATVEISDRGIGIPEAELERIFARFGRASNARARGIPGSGVGLYLAKKIVDVHGGRLTVRSSEGCGSTFAIVLPA